MARILIEEYRKWEIFFDTDKEEFYTVSNEFDKENVKKSYAATKKFIDDYIKDNFEFKPVQVQNLKTTYSNQRVMTLIGIRKDGLFMCEEKGKKSQFSKYDEDSFFLVNEDNNVLFKEIEELMAERDAIDNKIKAVEKKVVKVTVADYRKLLQNDANK